MAASEGQNSHGMRSSKVKIGHVTERSEEHDGNIVRRLGYTQQLTVGYFTPVNVERYGGLTMSAGEVWPFEYDRSQLYDHDYMGRHAVRLLIRPL